MPTGAPTRCSEPGCSVLCPPGTSRCAAHTRPRRTDPMDPRLSAQWPALRAQVLAQHPTCQHPSCGADATEVDHIVPIFSGGAAFDRGNLQALCHEHHMRKSAIEGMQRKQERQQLKGKRMTRVPRDAQWL